MKLSNLFFCFLMVVSFGAANAQEDGQEWEKGEYEEMLATYPKLYVYPDGRYLITSTFQKKSEKVAFAVLFHNKDIEKIKPKGKLSEKFVRKYLKGIEPFNPVTVMMRPPCCHIYDKYGRLSSSYYPPIGCPADCKKPFQKNGKTFQMNCCPPEDMNGRLIANLQLQVRPR